MKPCTYGKEMALHANTAREISEIFSNNTMSSDSLDPMIYDSIIDEVKFGNTSLEMRHLESSENSARLNMELYKSQLEELGYEIIDISYEEGWSFGSKDYYVSIHISWC
jgi:hypothetical protein